jgi:hypothetical protein
MAGDTVQIAYLISYYRDAGSLWGVCTLPWPLHDSSCDGHNGDSEAIYLDVYYRAATRHWVLNKAEYSAHNWPGVILRGTAAYPTGLEYPTHPGAYPRAWVSEGKHANYATQGGCNGGGNFDIDRCYDNDTSARLPAGADLNIGSSINHTATQDCMPSQDPLYQYYGSGRLECYWTNVQFRGWIPSWIGGAASDPYAPKLSAHGF